MPFFIDRKKRLAHICNFVNPYAHPHRIAYTVYDRDAIYGTFKSRTIIKDVSPNDLSFSRPLDVKLYNTFYYQSLQNGFIGRASKAIPLGPNNMTVERTIRKEEYLLEFNIHDVSVTMQCSIQGLYLALSRDGKMDGISDNEVLKHTVPFGCDWEIRMLENGRLHTKKVGDGGRVMMWLNPKPIHWKEKNALVEIWEREPVFSSRKQVFDFLETEDFFGDGNIIYEAIADFLNPLVSRAKLNFEITHG